MLSGTWWPRWRLAVGLSALALLMVACVAAWPDRTPFTVLMIPLLIGSMFLSPRQMPWFLAWTELMIVVAVLCQDEVTWRIAGAAVVQMMMVMIVAAVSIRRVRLGVGGLRGESMLVDLRDRLAAQGAVPQLPPGWRVETALESAEGTPFAGDFLVAARFRDRLELAVVDVSGKGIEAGTRALLLSGAFGGLLGAMQPKWFLPSANRYLLEQDWPEGFASAIHVSLDLRTGAYEVRTAGHPPAVHRAAGSGRWTWLSAEGTVLGIVPDVEFEAVSGTLMAGDVLLLYTDGVVEVGARDIELGIDSMLGAAEQSLRERGEVTVSRLVRQLGSPADDRAMAMIGRF